MAATTQERFEDLEPPIRAIGTDLAARMPRPRAVSAARVERRLQELLMSDPALRAALFRFVDVRPACATPADVTRHLHELLDDASESTHARRASSITGRKLATRPVAAIAATGVKQMAQRFIVGADAKDSLPTITGLWKNGVDATVDLLGEATVSEAEADRYMQRCEDALRVLSAAATKYPARDVNLSVKVSALTPLLRPEAPERGIEGARPRLRHLLGVARDVGAHLHVDMESFDTREAITRLTLELLSEPEFADGPSAGIVLQAYLTESPEHLEHLLEWAAEHPRKHPFTIRLVKGAYWDHEVVQAAQNGWAPPVFMDRRACDRNFELLSKRLIDARGGARQGGDREPQPALDLARRRLRGRPQRRQRAARVPDPARAGGRHPGRDRRQRPPCPRVLPGRRPRRGHGLPRAPPAREHRQRLLPRRARRRHRHRPAPGGTMTEPEARLTRDQSRRSGIPEVAL